MPWIALLFLSTLVYAVVRYVAFMPENAHNLPVYVVNKAMSMAAALCFVAAFFQQMRLNRGALVKVEPTLWFRAGVFGVFVHVPLALIVLRPSYFPEFFGEDRFSFAGEMVFFFGALTAGGIYLLHRAPAWQPITRWWASMATLGCLLGHVLAMGVCRGLNINASHAYLPPMWLLSLIGISAGIGFLLKLRPSATPGPPTTAA